MPFFANKLATRERDSQYAAVTNMVETVAGAAKIYLRDNMDKFLYQVTEISGEKLSDTLEPFGLPIGFATKTALGQNLSLVIDKNELGVLAYVALWGGDLSEIRAAELARRLGFYASHEDGNVYLIIPLNESYSDTVHRRDPNPDESGFLSDLGMGGFSISNARGIYARGAELASSATNELSLFGQEDGRKIRNAIENLTAGKTIFQSGAGDAALSVTRGTLYADSLVARTIANFGDTGNITVGNASVADLSMSAGRSGFTGPSKWDVRGNVVTDNISFTTELLDISSYIDASRGQNVYMNDDSQYSSLSGIETEILRTSNITLRDQISTSLVSGGTGAIVLDIRPAGVSVLPDVLINNISNDVIRILSNPDKDDDKTTECRAVISGTNSRYNANSLAQNLVCQFVFWHRLEQRVNIKMEEMGGL